ncbi:hypothetical protein [Arsenophonus nasoniae]|uniref:hypothetical protein n=1 Tax=Arsenophonus nasoniae TaxID=638 RepID=UPI00387A3BEF
MSCYIVNNKTASSIVTGLIETHHIQDGEAQAFLALMMNANVSSVNFRYLENNTAPNYLFEKQESGSLHSSDNIYMNYIQLVKNIDFFNYQCFDNDNYYKSLVFKALSSLREDLMLVIQGFLVKEKFYTQREAENLTIDQYPCAEKCTWGLED